MKPSEVKAVLGDPAQTEFASDKFGISQGVMEAGVGIELKITS